MNDTIRLGWMIESGAYVGWNREGEYCRVYVPTYAEEGYQPAEGWDVWYEDARIAIDKAIEKLAPHVLKRLNNV